MMVFRVIKVMPYYLSSAGMDFVGGVERSER